MDQLILKKISKALLLALVLLGLIELVLQIVALGMTPQSRAKLLAQAGQPLRILAVGDSNTFGLYLEEHEAWPARLQAMSADSAQALAVINVGFPGSNSFRTRANLPALLDEFSPDIVLLMIGFNDFWTPQEELENREPHLWERSRLWRFWRIASRSIAEKEVSSGMPRQVLEIDLSAPDVQQLIVDGKRYHLGTLEGEMSKNNRQLPDNLRAMAAMVEAAGAKPVLLTYPSNWGFYGGANRRIKEAAASASLPLIDITPLFIERCPDGPKSCSALMFDDGHPRAPGYELVADKIWQSLAQLGLILPPATPAEAPVR